MSELKLDTVRPELPEPGLNLFNSWLLATFAGWLAGLLLVITMAMLGDMLGFAGLQVMLGLGMGAGVGFMQGRVVRQWFGSARPWLWSSAIGIGAPFLLSDLLNAAWPGLSYSLMLNVAVGGLLAGYLQARILKPHASRAGMWIATSLGGWALAAGTTVISGLLVGVLPGFYGALINLVLILLGGGVLGAATGLALQAVFRN